MSLLSTKLAKFFIALILFSAHVGLVLYHYPVSIFLTNQFPVAGDLPRYIATVEGVERIGGVGYDYSSMAGYPVGVWNSIGKKGYELLCSVVPVGGLQQRMYIVVVFAAVLAPVFYFLVLCYALSVYRLSRILLALSSLVLWHLDSQIAYFWHFGNVLYPAAASLLPMLCVLACGMCSVHRAGVVASLCLGLLLALVVYVHTAMVFAFAFPLIGSCVYKSYSCSSLRPIYMLMLSGTVATCLAGPWLYDLFQTRELCVPQPYQWFQAGPKHLVCDMFNDRVYLRHFDRNFLFQATLILGIFGLVVSWSRCYDGVKLIGLTGCWCVIIAYTFSYIPSLKSVQPYRFLVPAVFCLAVPSWIAIARCYEIICGLNASQRGVFLLLGLLVMPSFTGYLIDLSQPPIQSRITREDHEILLAIARLPLKGRVVCQPDTVAHLLPVYTGKPVIGGLSDQAFLKHRFVGMSPQGVLFGRSPDQWTEVSLREYLANYAVGYAVFTSRAWIDVARSMPELLRFREAVGGSVIFEVLGPCTYFFEGSGDLSFHGGSIDLLTSDSYVVLRLHYSSFLRPPQGVELFPVSVIPDDPVPFLGVRLSRPGGKVTIRCR